jgi:23S rRNA (uracil1939-C5)-methyltransferase
VRAMTETIVRLAGRGDGVDGTGVYHPYTAPGDVIATDGSVTAGPHREVPPCRHFGRCGGCQLQHVDDVTYSQFMTDRIVSALAAQGMQAKIREPVLSLPHTRRRTSMRASRRGKQITLGFAEPGSHTLVDLAECPVLDPALTSLIKPLRGLLAKILPERRTANIGMTLADQGVDMLVSGVDIEGLAAVEALVDFGAQNSLARLSIDEGFGPSARYEPQPVTVTVSGLAVPLPDGCFLQATPDGESILAASVTSALEGCKAKADLFAGIGTLTYSTGACYAAEGARDAVLALKATVNAAVLAISVEHRDLFRRPLSAAELARFDGVVIDPPRAGAKEQVAELAASSVKRIAYVSCNPSTFARDARTLLDGGYTLDWIQPVGQFLWSTHVELAACFSR